MELNDLHRQLQLLNQDPVNQACWAVLPPDWRAPSALHCLSLARWGLENLTLSLTSAGPTDDDMEATLLRLESWSPARAHKWLINGSESEAEEVILTADDVAGLTLEEAAAAVLDALYSQIVVHGY